MCWIAAGLHSTWEYSSEERKYLHLKRNQIPWMDWNSEILTFCVCFHLQGRQNFPIPSAYWWAKGWISLVDDSIWHFYLLFLRGCKKYLFGQQTLPKHLYTPCCMWCRASPWQLVLPPPYKSKVQKRQLKVYLLVHHLADRKESVLPLLHRQRQRAQGMHFPPCNTS